MNQKEVVKPFAMVAIRRMLAPAILFLLLLAGIPGQSHADIVVNITNDGFGGVVFNWSGQVNSLAGLTPGGNQYLTNQIGAGSGGYFLVGDGNELLVDAGYSGFSGVLNQPSFSSESIINGPSNDPGIGAILGRIYLPKDYVLGTLIFGSAFDSNTEVTTFTNSVVSWDGGNESFRININPAPVPEPASAGFIIICTALVGLVRRRQR